MTKPVERLATMNLTLFRKHQKRKSYSHCHHYYIIFSTFYSFFMMFIINWLPYRSFIYLSNIKLSGAKFNQFYFSLKMKITLNDFDKNVHACLILFSNLWMIERVETLFVELLFSFSNVSITTNASSVAWPKRFPRLVKLSFWWMNNLKTQSNHPLSSENNSFLSFLSSHLWTKGT